MSAGQHNSAHVYNGRGASRGARLRSKLGRTITLTRLDQLLGRKEDTTMGTQRITIDVYGAHETVVEEAKNVVKYLADTGKGLTPAAAKVVNHPGADDESITDLLAG